MWSINGSYNSKCEIENIKKELLQLRKSQMPKLKLTSNTP